MTTVPTRRRLNPHSLNQEDDKIDTDTVPPPISIDEAPISVTGGLIRVLLVLTLIALPCVMYYQSSTSVLSSSTASSNSTEMSGSALFEAVNKGDLDAVNKALANGENPNTLNAQGQAPLHVIATKSFRNENTLPIILTLVKNKADVNLKNSAGFTPMQVAFQSGWQDTGAFLFEVCGAKYDAEIRKNTKITCPDCLRVSKSIEENNFKPTGYQFENKKWIGVKAN